MTAPTLQPRASYRLQLRPGFGFDEAAAIADYLRELGVSHVYLSPILQATPGSTHGYDVVDPGKLSADLGGPAAHDRLCRRLGACGLGQLLDIVPNHMAIGPDNPWWWDVLENGPSSLFAHFFDVDWAPPEQRLHNKVLLPVLGDHAGRVIDAGELQIVRRQATFTIRYHEHAAPVAPRSLAEPIGRAARRCGSPDLAFIADALAGLPLPTATDLPSLERRHRDKEVLRGQLARLVAERPEVGPAIDAELAALNGDPDQLDRFLALQNCRLAFWRTAARDLGYRRFFDINSLAALRMEDGRVFAATHALIGRWLAEGVIDGVRVDHIDGLLDPAGYLQRLRDVAPGAWILVEKILEPGEALPDAWPVDGTTGYDFLNQTMHLQVAPSGREPLEACCRRFTGDSRDFATLAYECKRAVITELFGSDRNRLTALFLEICEHNRRFRDYSRHELHEVLGEALCSFPVYRSYVNPQEGEASGVDATTIEQALAGARARRPELDGALFDFLADILLGRVAGTRERALLARLQQLTGPVMAKGVEDTACYLYGRLLAVNEVGGSPDHFGIALEDFHRDCQRRLARHPRAMLATSTHDTKRSEDVRARLCLLSEIPAHWAELVERLSALAGRHRSGDAPDRTAEYLFYQTLIGAWPLDRDRAVAYMAKLAREGKARTSWTRPDQAYEAALTAFVEGTLSDPDFVQAVERFVAPLVWPGRVNALAQTLIKLTAPGVPDIYQGTELWDLSLVDPDNRRPVDFEQRRRLLGALADTSPEQVLARADEGLPKLWVVRQALALRRERPDAFGAGAAHVPLEVRGARAEHVVAYARGGEVVTVVPRWPLLLAGDWAETAVNLPEGRWRDRLTGEQADGGPRSIAGLLARFPVALLARTKT